VVKFVEVSFPKMSMQYGSNVESLVSYFSVRQYLPFKRMKECFSDVFGLNLSQGSIAGYSVSNSATNFGVLVPRISVQTVPLLRNVLLTQNILNHGRPMNMIHK
jgi:hypothetical protein